MRARGATLPNTKLVIQSFLLQEWWCTFCSHCRNKDTTENGFCVSVGNVWRREVGRTKSPDHCGTLQWEKLGGKIPILGLHFGTCGWWCRWSPPGGSTKKLQEHAWTLLLNLRLGGDLPWKKIELLQSVHLEYGFYSLTGPVSETGVWEDLIHLSNALILFLFHWFWSQKMWKKTMSLRT